MSLCLDSDLRRGNAKTCEVVQMDFVVQCFGEPVAFSGFIKPKRPVRIEFLRRSLWVLGPFGAVISHC